MDTTAASRAPSLGAAQPVDQRIRDSFSVTEDGHWLWRLRVDQDGYGQMKINRTSRPVARLIYEVFVGDIPEGCVVGSFSTAS